MLRDRMSILDVPTVPLAGSSSVVVLCCFTAICAKIGSNFFPEKKQWPYRLVFVLFEAVAAAILLFSSATAHETANRTYTMAITAIQLFNTDSWTTVCFYVLRAVVNLWMFLINIDFVESFDETLIVALTLFSAFLMYHLNSTGPFYHKVMLVVVNATTVLELVSFCYISKINVIYAVLVEINCCIYSFNSKKNIEAMKAAYCILFSASCALRAIIYLVNHLGK